MALKCCRKMFKPKASTSPTQPQPSPPDKLSEMAFAVRERLKSLSKNFASKTYKDLKQLKKGLRHLMNNVQGAINESTNIAFVDLVQRINLQDECNGFLTIIIEQAVSKCATSTHMDAIAEIVKALFELVDTLFPLRAGGDHTESERALTSMRSVVVRSSQCLLKAFLKVIRDDARSETIDWSYKDVILEQSLINLQHILTKEQEEATDFSMETRELFREFYGWITIETEKWCARQTLMQEELRVRLATQKRGKGVGPCNTSNSQKITLLWAHEVLITVLEKHGPLLWEGAAELTSAGRRQLDDPRALARRSLHVVKRMREKTQELKVKNWPSVQKKKNVLLAFS